MPLHRGDLGRSVVGGGGCGWKFAGAGATLRLVPPLRFVVLAAVAAGLAAAVPATAQTGQPTGPWNGDNPFNCVNQDVGTGTDFPFPNADPFCVEFDKTSQNVT